MQFSFALWLDMILNACTCWNGQLQRVEMDLSVRNPGPGCLMQSQPRKHHDDLLERGKQDSVICVSGVHPRAACGEQKLNKE